MKAHWGNERLTYQGKPFFGSGKTVYDDINKVLKKMKDVGVEVQVTISLNNELGFDELSYEADLDDFQEVYLGFDPRSGNLYVGIDAWLKEDDFNEAFESEFKNVMDEEFDHSNDEHRAAFDDAWKKYSNMGFYGVLIELSGDPIRSGEVLEDAAGGFYKGIYKGSNFKALNLIDLRLD